MNKVRIELQVELNYDVGEHGADFIFNIQAARTACRRGSRRELSST